MRTIFRLFLCFTAVFGTACASSTDSRLSRLEAQSQSMHVLDLRMSHVEERLTGVEKAVGELRDDAAGGEGKATGAAPAKDKAYRVPSASRRAESRAAAAPVPAVNVPIETPVVSAPLGVPVDPKAVRYVQADAGTAAAAPAAPQAPSLQYPAAPQAPSLQYPAAPQAPSLQPLATPGKAVSPAKPASRSPGNAGSPAYEAALALYYKGNYAKAEQDFAAFSTQQPNHRLAPNALYWQGECRYSRGNFDGAILMFKDVAAKYPKHAKAPDALLKAGYAYARLNDKENARFYWQLLLDDYPNSKAAGLARKRMAER